MFPTGMGVERVYVAARTGEGRHHRLRHFAAVVIGQPCVDISRAGAQAGGGRESVPRGDGADGLLALAVLEFVIL